MEQRTATSPDELRRAVSQYAHLIGAHVMAVSRLKGHSWGLDEDVVPLAVDPEQYLPHRGDIARGLRVANDIQRKLRTLKWDFHEKAFDGVPLTIVGRNDDMPGVRPSADWEDLKQTLSRHRFFIYTADPSLEDGYNMAVLEAMAAGLPVLGNLNPTSPVQHGVSGFLADDPLELRGFARQLLKDPHMAAQMGAQARRTVAREFSAGAFLKGFKKTIGTAQGKWELSQKSSGTILRTPCP